MTRRSHHRLTLTAALLAAAVAAGVATPRPRLGRERTLRTVALAASTRPDQPCASGPAEDPEPNVTVAASDPLAHPDQQLDPTGASTVPSGCPTVARAVARRLLPDPDAVAAAATARTGPPPGRAPPVSRS